MGIRSVEQYQREASRVRHMALRAQTEDHYLTMLSLSQQYEMLAHQAAGVEKSRRMCQSLALDTEGAEEGRPKGQDARPLGERSE